MKRVLWCGAVALATVLSATPAWAQVRPASEDREPQVHRMDIYSGGLRTVHYFGQNMSSGDQTTLADLERSENQASTGDLLGQLHREYLVNERAMEARRHQVQMLLYGYSSETGAGGLTSSAPLTPYAYAPSYGYSSVIGAGGLSGVAPFVGSAYAPRYNSSYLYAGSPYLGAGTFEATATNSLANGIGDEGVLKKDLARTWSAQATPERIAELRRDRDAIAARISQSDGLRAAFNPGAKGGVVPAANDSATRPHVVVTTKSNEKIEGTLVNDDKEWLTVDTGKEEVSVRSSDAVRIVKGKTKVMPTSNP